MSSDIFEARLHSKPFPICFCSRMKYLLRKAKRVPRKTGFMPRVHHPPYGSSGIARHTRGANFSGECGEWTSPALSICTQAGGTYNLGFISRLQTMNEARNGTYGIFVI